MVSYEDECVGCVSLGMRCKGEGCPNRHVPHFWCDECGEELGSDELYEVDGDMFCANCTLERCKADASSFL